MSLRSQSIWNGEQLKQHFTQSELINHLLLSEEMYYLWRENDVVKILDYVQDAYPETTAEDIRRVYGAQQGLHLQHLRIIMGLINIFKL